MIILDKETTKKVKVYEILKRNIDVCLSIVRTYDEWEDYKEDCDYENVKPFPINNKEEFNLIKEYLNL